MRILSDVSPLIIDVGPNILLILLTLISTCASVVAALHASQARENSGANHAMLHRQLDRQEPGRLIMPNPSRSPTDISKENPDAINSV